MQQDSRVDFEGCLFRHRSCVEDSGKLFRVWRPRESEAAIATWARSSASVMLTGSEGVCF